MNAQRPFEKLALLEKEQDSLMALWESGKISPQQRARLDLLEEEIQVAKAAVRNHPKQAA